MDKGLFPLFVLIAPVIPTTLHEHAHRKINCLILILFKTRHITLLSSTCCFPLTLSYNVDNLLFLYFVGSMG